MISTVKLSFENFHDSGSYAEVYRIGDKALKCPYDTNTTLRIEREFEIQKQLFKAGVRVPKPYELVNVKLSTRKVLGIMMEFIDGKRASRLGILRTILAKGLYINEVGKAESLGFMPGDSDLYNSIYSRKKGLYLIDFDHWGRK